MAKLITQLISFAVILALGTVALVEPDWLLEVEIVADDASVIAHKIMYMLWGAAAVFVVKGTRNKPAPVQG